MRSSGERGEGWFAALYAAHHRHVVKYALRRLADLDAATDLAKEVFVVAWRRRVQVPDRGLPWLYGVARRLLANQWRARRSVPTILPLATGGAGHEQPAPNPAAQGALSELPELDQEILQLVGWERTHPGEGRDRARLPPHYRRGAPPPGAAAPRGGDAPGSDR